MGNIAPCIPNGSVSILDSIPNAFTALTLCDKWATLHVVNIFLTAIFTRSPFFAFFLAFFGEALEHLPLAVLGNYGVFIATGDGLDSYNPNTNFESVVDSVILDALIQGGIGTLLGWTFIHMISFPPMMTWGDLWDNPPRFWYYFLVLIGFLILLPSILYGITVGSTFYLGINLSYIIYVIVFFTFVYYPNRKEPNRWTWFGWWIIPVTVLHVQNNFDYLGGGAPQSWLWSGVIWLTMVVYSAYRWKWYRKIYFDYEWYVCSVDFRYGIRSVQVWMGPGSVYGIYTGMDLRTGQGSESAKAKGVRKGESGAAAASRVSSTVPSRSGGNQGRRGRKCRLKTLMYWEMRITGWTHNKNTKDLVYRFPICPHVCKERTRG